MTSYGYSQRTYGPPPPPPPTTQLHGAELRDALARVHGRLLAPSANRSLPAMLADDRHLGPSAVACVEADGDGGVADAFSGAFGGWPAGGDRAGVGLRSLSKMSAAAAFLALVDTKPTRGSRCRRGWATSSQSARRRATSSPAPPWRRRSRCGRKASTTG